MLAVPEEPMPISIPKSPSPPATSNSKVAEQNTQKAAAATPPPAAPGVSPGVRRDFFEVSRPRTGAPNLTGGSPVKTDPVVNPPTNPANGNEAANLWSDLDVQEAQAQVEQSPPGAGQTIVTIDHSFLGPQDHGTYCTAIAAGPPSSNLPGIAAGAGGIGVSWGRDPDVGNTTGLVVGGAGSLIGIPGAEDLAADNAQDMLADGAPATFSAAAGEAGPDGIVQVTSPMSFIDEADEAIAFLEEVQRFTESGGVAVLPSNLFPQDIASQPEVQQAITESGAIITTPLMRDGNGDGTVGDVSYPNGQNGQMSTLPTDMVTVAVPTTNGNNSVAVPGVAGTIALMKQVNPDLTAAQIASILSDPANFESVTLPDGNTVTVLNANAAVAAAQQ